MRRARPSASRRTTAAPDPSAASAIGPIPSPPIERQRRRREPAAFEVRQRADQDRRVVGERHQVAARRDRARLERQGHHRARRGGSGHDAAVAVIPPDERNPAARERGEPRSVGLESCLDDVRRRSVEAKPGQGRQSVPRAGESRDEHDRVPADGPGGAEDGACTGRHGGREARPRGLDAGADPRCDPGAPVLRHRGDASVGRHRDRGQRRAVDRQRDGEPGSVRSIGVPDRCPGPRGQAHHDEQSGPAGRARAGIGGRRRRRLSRRGGPRVAPALPRLARSVRRGRRGPRGGRRLAAGRDEHDGDEGRRDAGRRGGCEHGQRGRSSAVLRRDGSHRSRSPPRRAPLPASR